MKMGNPTSSAVKFRISGEPGEPPVMYDVAPGDYCDIPTGYVESGHYKKFAPGLVLEADMPEVHTKGAMHSPIQEVLAEAPEAEAPLPLPLPKTQKAKKGSAKAK